MDRNDTRLEILSVQLLASSALAMVLLALAGVGYAAQTASLSVTSPSLASAAPTSAPPDAAPVGADRLEALGMGDMLRVTVFRNPELTTEARVSERGTIVFPMIGEVPVSGLTPSQAATRIADKLRSGKYVVNPEVTVTIAQVNSRQVSVLGNVNKPGRYPLDALNVKLTDLISTAGGIAPTGSDLVTIVSKDGTKSDVDLEAMFRKGDLSKNVALEPGDTIYVHKAPMVYVYGEVQKGGAYRVEPNMTVMQAIALSGGINPRGTQRGIKLSRRDAKGNVERMDVSLTDPVQPDDVIFIRESYF
jgi:polysaccharide export outer membrane protein